MAWYDQLKAGLPASKYGDLLPLLDELAAGIGDRDINLDDIICDTVTANTVTSTSMVGTVTGGLNGTHTGNAALGSVLLSPVEMTASGAISASASFVELNKADGSLAITLTQPTAGRVLTITQSDAGTSGHTVTLTTGTFDGTNTVATFDARFETLVLLGTATAGRFIILHNAGSVGLSAP